MKIRNDFVTNSSSSSFILGFSSVDNIKEELSKEKRLPKIYLEKVLKDCNKSEILSSIEDVINDINDYIEWVAEFITSNDDEKNQKINEIKTNIRNKSKDKNVFCEVEYSDNECDYGTGLEFNIMPYLDCTIYIINNH